MLMPCPWSSEQPDLAMGVPAHWMGVGQMTFKGPFHLKQFYNSMNLIL